MPPLNEIESQTTLDPTTHSVLGSLSRELRTQILMRIPPKELATLCSLNKDFRALVNDNNLWLMKLAQHFPDSLSLYNKIDNAYAIFRQAYAKSYRRLTEREKKIFSQAKEGDAALLAEVTSEDFKIFDNRNLTLLHWLAINQHQTLLNELYSIREDTGICKWLPSLSNLQRAIYFNQAPERITEYFQEAADSEKVDAFHMAAFFGRLQLIKTFFKLHAFSTNMRTVLFKAAFSGQLEVVKYLCSLTTDNKPSVNLVENTLYSAACSGQLEVVKYLCSLTTDNKPSADSMVNALYAANLGGQLEVVKHLCNLTTDNKPSANSVRYLLKYERLTPKIRNWLQHLQANNAYSALCSRVNTPWEKTVKLLSDYTKDDSTISRFFHGHWNRHHVSSVNTLIKQMKEGRITKDNLLEALHQIKLVNEAGSLARRINYIEVNLIPLMNEAIPPENGFTSPSL